MLRSGKRVRSELFELRGLASHSSVGRIGLIVPKHRHSAVRRNRLKRRLREIVRLHCLPELAAVEIIIRAQPAAYALSSSHLEAELKRLLPQLLAKVC